MGPDFFRSDDQQVRGREEQYPVRNGRRRSSGKHDGQGAQPDGEKPRPQGEGDGLVRASGLNGPPDVAAPVGPPDFSR